jgi:Predicted permease
MKWKDKINWKYMQISLYAIITVVIIYALSLIVKNAPTLTAALFNKLNWVLKVLKPIILGFVFAYLMDPIANFFEEKYRKLKNVKLFNKIVAPRTWATFTGTLLLVIAITGLVSLLVFTVTNQIKLASFNDIIKLAQVYKNNIDAFFNAVQDKLSEFNIQSPQFDQYFENATTFILDTLKNIATSALNSITNISDYLTTIIFSFIIGIYFMIDGRMFMAYMGKVSRALFSDNVNKKLQNSIHDLDEVFSGYIRGQLADAFVMMILISLILSITGVKFSIVIGICAGIGNLIPYFGPIVAYVGTTVVCLFNGDIKILVVSIIALFVIQALDGNIIGPKLLSQSIQIHPLIIIISIIIGSALGGFLGMLLAVPVGAYVKLIFVRFVDRRIEHKEELKEIESKSKIRK